MSTVTPVSEALDAIAQRRAQSAQPSPENWWYYAKKAVALYPGVRTARRGAFLDDYYSEWEQRLGPARIALNAAALAAFRRWIPSRTAKIAKRYGFGEEWISRTVTIARDRIIDPAEVALFSINDPDQVGSYLRSFEWNAITRRINRAQWQPGCLLKRKFEFHCHAVAHGLPVPQLVAVVEDGQAFMVEAASSPSLFAKPDTGRGGGSAQQLELEPEQLGNSNAQKKLLETKEALSNGHWIIQETLQTHEAILPIAMSAVPTVRVVTMLNESNEPEAVVHYLRFASTADAVVDNSSAGGLMAWIDPMTATLGTGCMKRTQERLDRHPANGEAITGREVPYVAETLALACRAHADLSQYSIIGWDIAITPGGPVIVEGNGKPDLQAAQQVWERGLGEMRAGELIAFHLANRGARHQRAAPNG